MSEVEQKSHGRAVVLLHGLCSSSLELRVFARTFRERGFHVVVPTISGYSALETGGALRDREPDFRRWIADAVGEIDRLASYSEVDLCGVSLGATLALALCAQRPEAIGALSVISTTLWFDGWNVSRWRHLLPLAYYTPLGAFYRYREVPPYGVKNERVRAWIAGQLRRRPLSSAGASTIPTVYLREADRLIRHVKMSLGRVRSPTLMIHAREDDVASLANVRYVRQHIGASTFFELIVEDSYHMITLDNDRDHAALKTVQFFDACAQRRSEFTHVLPRFAQSLSPFTRSQIL